MVERRALSSFWMVASEFVGLLLASRNRGHRTVRLMTPSDRRNLEDRCDALGETDEPAGGGGRARVVGLVGPGRRIARGGDARLVSGDRPDESALPDEPALRLVDAAGELLLFFGLGLLSGGNHQALAPARRMAEPAAALRLGDPARC